MKRKVVVGLLLLAFVLGAIVGSTVRPPSVAATGSSVQFWGPRLNDPNAGSYKLLVLYDSSTGEIWGYHTIGGQDPAGDPPSGSESEHRVLKEKRG